MTSPAPVSASNETPIGRLQHKSLCSLQRSLAMCHEMDVYARHTMEKLDEGDKKIQLIDQHQTQMESDLIQTADVLDDMKTCCGINCTPWGKKNRPDVEDTAQELAFKQPEETMTNQPGIRRGNNQEIILIHHDPLELQMDYDLELVEGFVDELEHMSDQIAQKLEKDARALDKTTLKVDRNITRIGFARKQAKTIIDGV